MTKTVSLDVRPKFFAALELALDVWHIARANADRSRKPDDLSVRDGGDDASLVLGGESPPEVLASIHPAEEYRGSISRLLVADRLSLPRETVRRKIKAMVKDGLLMQDDEGRVRVVSRLADAAVAVPSEVHAAVLRYHERLKSLGVSYPDDEG